MGRLSLLIFIAAIASLVVAGPGPEPVEGAFPGANGKIAFYSNRDDPDDEIYVMNADGSAQTRLTNSPGVDRQPAWSPDGTKIAFATTRDGNAEVYVMNADGTGQTNLTNNPAADYEPAWSPDGSQIVFTTNRDDLASPDGDSEIYVMNANGTGQTRLTNNSAFDGQPAWSPDGTKIAFNTNRDGGCCPTPQHHEIYVMNADGSGQTNLSNDFFPDGVPDWSPDGTKIAYHSSRPPLGVVIVMNSDGTGETILTNTVSDAFPAWSPDGTKITHLSGRDGNSEIYVMNADGSGPTRLTNNPAEDVWPDWQPLLPATPTPTATPTAPPTPTPTQPPSVGGISVDPHAAAPALERAGSSGQGAGVPAALAAGALVCAAAAGVAWYARRHRLP